MHSPRHLIYDNIHPHIYHSYVLLHEVYRDNDLQADRKERLFHLRVQPYLVDNTDTICIHLLYYQIKHLHNNLMNDLSMLMRHITISKNIVKIELNCSFNIPERHSSQWKPAVLLTHFKHSPVSWLQFRTAFKSMLLLQSQGRQAIPFSGLPK